MLLMMMELKSYGLSFLYIIQYTSNVPQVHTTFYQATCLRCLPCGAKGEKALWWISISCQTLCLMCFFLLNKAWSTKPLQSTVWSSFFFILSGINELAAKHTEGQLLDGPLSSIVWIK